MLKFHVVHPRELTPDQRVLWSRLHATESHLDTAFLRPEFAQAVGAVRSDAEVAMFEQDGELVGFFPFHRRPGNMAWPIGMMLCDFQDAIVRRGVEWTAAELVRGCGLAAIHFDSLVTGQVVGRELTNGHAPQPSPLESFRFSQASSPFIDLRDGFDGYARRHEERLGYIAARARRFERKAGQLVFRLHVDDGPAFHDTLTWKSEQRRRTKTFDVLEFPWVRELLDRLRQVRTADFSAVLSTLHAGDQLVATHFGLRAGNVLHYWFPALNAEFEKSSPGMVLLGELTRACAAAGITRLDLGKGDESYKVELMSGEFELAEGVVDGRPLRSLYHAAWYRGRDWLRHSRLRRFLQTPKRWLRSIYFRRVVQ